jgi:hypothetical protein
MGIIGRMKTGAMLTSAVANSAFSFALRAFRAGSLVAV